jgi:predicted DNA-binding protein (UPF0278 family)
MSFIFESKFAIDPNGQRCKIELETPSNEDSILLAEHLDGAILDKDEAIKWFAHKLSLANKRNKELREQILELQTIIGI